MSVQEQNMATADEKTSVECDEKEKPVVAQCAEEPPLPENNLPLVFFSLLLATFLVSATSSSPSFC